MRKFGYTNLSSMTEGKWGIKVRNTIGSKSFGNIGIADSQGWSVGFSGKFLIISSLPFQSKISPSAVAGDPCRAFRTSVSENSKEVLLH